MYKFEYDLLYGKWNVYYVNSWKYDFICSFDSLEEASAFCDEKNLALVKFGSK
jgi:hypothetical protein